MGCVLGKGAGGGRAEGGEAPGTPPAREGRSDRHVAFSRRSQSSLSKTEVGADAADVVAAMDEASSAAPGGEKPRRRRAPRSTGNVPGHVKGEQVAAGWPAWLSAVAGEAIKGWTPRRADTFEKLDKVRDRGFDAFLLSGYKWKACVFSRFINVEGILDSKVQSSEPNLDAYRK